MFSSAYPLLSSAPVPFFSWTEGQFIHDSMYLFSFFGTRNPAVFPTFMG